MQSTNLGISTLCVCNRVTFNVQPGSIPSPLVEAGKSNEIKVSDVEDEITT